MDDDMETSTASEIERIKERTAELIRRRLSKPDSTYYLSSIGNDLGEDRVLLERLTKMKLSDFIRQKMNYDLEKTGKHSNVLYIGHAVPPSETESEGKIVTPLYENRFWAAFRVPLPTGERRFINVTTRFFGPDETSLVGPNSDVREIEREYISTREDAGNDPEVVGRIARWLEAQKLDL